MNIFPIEQAHRSIRWKSVKESVPDDRRPVLAWGPIDWLFGTWKRKAQFLGVTRFNADKYGGRGRFDCEKMHAYSVTVCEVTHWAEITGPVDG